MMSPATAWLTVSLSSAINDVERVIFCFLLVRDVTLQRTSKKQKITRSTSFMADDKETVNHAVAGDIITCII
jgi:hypothetical protein